MEVILWIVFLLCLAILTFRAAEILSLSGSIDEISKRVDEWRKFVKTLTWCLCGLIALLTGNETFEALSKVFMSIA